VRLGECKGGTNVELSKRGSWNVFYGKGPEEFPTPQLSEKKEAHREYRERQRQLASFDVNRGNGMKTPLSCGDWVVRSSEYKRIEEEKIGKDIPASCEILSTKRQKKGKTGPARK